MTGLSVRGATVRRGKRLVLEDASFSAPAGTLTAVLGAAGAGKTSLLAAIAGLLKLERGTILCGGADVSRLPARTRGIGLLPPGSVLPAGSVQDGLRRLAGRRGATLLGPVADGLGLAPIAQAEAHALSHGQALLALNAARLTQPGAALLVDEAGAGLDADGQARLLACLRQRAAGGTAVLFATRSPALALAADHLVLLAGGHVLQAGPPARLYNEPRDAPCAQLTGPANILHGQVRELRAGAFVWSAGGRFVQAATPDVPRPTLGSAVSLCLRPEALVTLADGAVADNTMAGVVTSVTPGDGHRLVGLDCGLLAAVAGWPAVGQAMRFGWAAGASWVLE